jgi:uncharacterized protein YndB with AHSA1/START domain
MTMDTKPANTMTTTADREFVLTYTFDAPRAAVFAAYTDPKLVAQWWGPKGQAIRVDQMDLRPSGKWRFVQALPGGGEMAFHGVYTEISPVSRLAYTFNTEGQANPEILATVELTEAAGKTTLRLTNRCASKEHRDTMLKYGAEAGARVAWDRLAQAIRGR